MLPCSAPQSARRENTHTLLASAHRHTDRDTRTETHGQTPLSGHTFTQLTTGRTADMSQQRQTPTHTECDTDLHHNAHTHTQDGGRGTSAQCTTGRTAGKIYIRHSHTTLHHHTETHCYIPPQNTDTAPPHDTHTHTRTDNGNGGTMVKNGNIKVDLRSGAAVFQERTRTRTRTRIGHFEHFPRASVCAFPCRFSLPLLCRFLTSFCRAF